MQSNFVRTLCTVLVLGLGIGMGSQLMVRDQLTAKDADRAKQIPTLKMGVFNIAKVLREFKNANQSGLAISKRRQEYFDILKPLRERLESISLDLAQAATEMQKTGLRDEASSIDRKIKQLEKESQKEMSEMSDKIIVEVYVQIKEVVAELATENGAQILVAYPDASSSEDEFKPAIAQLKLQTPAMTPFYLNPELDLTEIVIARLNQKYPAEKPKALQESKR